ncbi:hypothetical protein LI328DRAFT_159103 [Trichoderma asperelloides]|nr:hypothetical protein LI328DRAFT_159103 [Trichoderma asperelloides]
MKYRGVVYDVGLNFNSTRFSVEPFDLALVKYDMKTIADDLHANTVRIGEGEISRLQIAARCFPGNSFNDRVMFLDQQFPSGHITEDIPQALRDKSVELNKALGSFVEVIRSWFGGRITYSAGFWEVVDWSIFDAVGIDYYRRGETAENYVSCLDRYRVGKPLVVLEVDGGFVLLKGTNPDGTDIFENDTVPNRSEKEQADYVGTQLELLNNAGVDAARDLDMMCFSLVKTFPEKDLTSKDMPPWVPKESFHRVAEVFRSMEQDE